MNRSRIKRKIGEKETRFRAIREFFRAFARHRRNFPLFRVEKFSSLDSHSLIIPIISGFYTSWLFPAAVVGILVFLYGLITVFDNPYANDVCEKPGKYQMCPQHELGKFWDLYDICTYIRISYLFDHPGSVFYSIFISFWGECPKKNFSQLITNFSLLKKNFTFPAVSFLEYWKRKCATIAYQWDCTDFQGEEERPRAEYAAKAPFIAVNPVTGIKEPMFPEGKRGKRIATGLGLVFVMVGLFYKMNKNTAKENFYKFFITVFFFFIADFRSYYLHFRHYSF